MLTITTFLARKNLSYYQENKDSAESYFVAITSEDAPAVIQSFSSRDIDRALYGAITIQAAQKYVTTFADWDDLDLLWTGFVTMVLDYLKNNKYGTADLSLNGLEWSLNRIQTQPKNLLSFHAKRPNAHYDGRTGTPASIETKATLDETEFLHELLDSAGTYLSFREKDTRTQNLIVFKERFIKVKHLVLELGLTK
ncbi:hypothetical protein [Planococcus beigongshangi]|uniref:hypothetical protein n=1 Tax=Planococcus beigongshangi TaxID=2782536 RepID=UPI00193C1CF1|nr:hypothetical protein [Planococcus beigongshangi]